MGITKRDEALGRLVLALKDKALADVLLPGPGVVHAYSAIDNTLSALIILTGKEPPQDHGKKIGLFRHHYPKAKEVVPRTRHLNRYLKRWLAARYDGTECQVGEFTEITHAANDLFDFAVRQIAKDTGDTPDAVYDSIRTRAAQERTEAWREEIDEDQERLSQVLQLQVEGRAGFTTAAIHPSNFISLHIDSDTPGVRELISQNPAVSGAAVEWYDKGLALIEMARIWNADRLAKEKGVKIDDGKTLAAAADFRLTAILHYRGTDLIEHMNRLWKSLGEAKKKLAAEREAEKK